MSSHRSRPKIRVFVLNYCASTTAAAANKVAAATVKSAPVQIGRLAWACARARSLAALHCAVKRANQASSWAPLRGSAAGAARGRLEARTKTNTANK